MGAELHQDHSDHLHGSISKVVSSLHTDPGDGQMVAKPYQLYAMNLTYPRSLPTINPDYTELLYPLYLP